MATATKTAKSLKVSCPFCSHDGTITIDLNDMRTCFCEGCSETFTPQQAASKAAEIMAKWEAVVAWLEAAPAE